jgi:hypothetical protein
MATETAKRDDAKVDEIARRNPKVDTRLLKEAFALAEAIKLPRARYRLERSHGQRCHSSLPDSGAASSDRAVIRRKSGRLPASPPSTGR